MCYMSVSPPFYSMISHISKFAQYVALTCVLPYIAVYTVI